MLFLLSTLHIFVGGGDLFMIMKENTKEKEDKHLFE